MTDTARLSLGDSARHAITGFTGIVVARVSFLTGCDQVCLQPQGLSEKGELFESRYFDEPYVDLVARNVVPDRTPGRATGCDISPPSRRG